MQIVVDPTIVTPVRARMRDVVGAYLRGLAGAESLIVVVTQLPSGGLAVFVNDIQDRVFLESMESALARVR